MSARTWLLVLLTLAGAAPSALAQPTEDAPLAFFTVTPQQGRTGATFTADAKLSEPSSSAANITTYEWRWGADGAFERGNVTSTRTFPRAGVYEVALRVTDDAGRAATAVQSILVEGARPLAYVSYRIVEQSATETVVLLNASFSEPSRGATRIVKYEWRFGDAPDENFTEGNATITHTYSGPGTFTAQLRVTDDEGRTATTDQPIVIGSTFLGRMLRVWADRDSFLIGAVRTLQLAVLTTGAGFVLAVVLALMRISRFALLYAPAAAYIEVIRGTPLLVQVLFAWLALPYIGIKLSIFWAGALALVVNTSAYQAEVIRAGVQSIPSGQMEAALSLGMTYKQAMRFIILPQAFRLTIPPLGNEFIILLKDTSILSVIGVVELTMVARIFSARTFLVLEPLLGIAAVYFIMTYTISYALRRTEKRLAIPGLGIQGAAH